MEQLLLWCDSIISYLKKHGVKFGNGYAVLPDYAYYTGIPFTIESHQFRNKIPESVRHRSLICYFSSDDRLIQRLFKIDDEIPELLNYGGICGFDLSASITMLRPRQRLCLLVNSLFNCYVAIHGVKVLPNCRTGDLANMSIISNIPPNTNIISGELGCKRNGFGTYGLYQLCITRKIVSPPIMFIYGSLSNRDIQFVCDRSPQNFVVYPSARDKYRNKKQPSAMIWNGSSIHKMPIEDFVSEGGSCYGC